MKIIADDVNTDVGCYVDGHWGQYGSMHLVEQFADLGKLSVVEREALEAWQPYPNMVEPTEDQVEIVLELADRVEAELNDVLPSGVVALWFDGEFFISPMCDDEVSCDDEACAHWM